MLINVLSNDIRKKVKKEVPFIADAYVEFWDDFLGDMSGTEELSADQFIYRLMLGIIADWNFSDGDEKLAITEENIKKLSTKTRTWLSETTVEIVNSMKEIREVKKKE
jgi:hypothetical protein